MRLALSDALSRHVILWLGAATALFHLAIIAQLPTWFGQFFPQQSLRAVSLVLAVGLIFMTTHWRGLAHSGGGRSIRITLVDLLLWAALTVGCLYIVFFHEAVLDYAFFGLLDTKGLILALCVAIPLLEAVRRKTGPVLPIIIVLFIAIAIFQQVLPGLLNGRGSSLARVMFAAYVGEVGIFGKPLGIAVNIVIVFLIFGALMEKAGASRWFMDLALSLTGWARGGPAKSAVAASALFGSISGSPSGNSATTGVFTIPMMKDVGYKPQFAAAVEAVASTGGIILPPVMGAIAFLMAEWIERPYVEVVIAALIPALLYFLVVFASVHFEARRNGIEALPRADIPNFLRVLASGWYYAVPMAALIYFLLIAAYTPGMAAIYTCAVVIACSFLSRDRAHWLTPRRILEGLSEAVMRWLVIAVITGSVGMMIGALELSGVGLNVSRFIVDLGGGNLLVTLVLVGIVSLIVGMGLDATPAYVTLASLMAPALIQMGLEPIAAHLYVIYWGLASFFTPPTCIAIFVTAPIAGANVWSAGWEAVRLGIAAFLVPIAFAMNPALLMVGTPLEIVQGVLPALGGALAIAAGLRGFALARLNRLNQVLMVLGGLLLIAPGWEIVLAGLALVAVALILSTWIRTEAAPVPLERGRQ
jgi:TRAP transporter 4TM/12TM fusion protein